MFSLAEHQYDSKMPTVLHFLSSCAPWNHQVSFPLTQPTSPRQSVLQISSSASLKLKSCLVVLFSAFHVDPSCSQSQPCATWAASGPGTAKWEVKPTRKFTWCTEGMGMLESTVPAQWKSWKFIALCPKSLGMRPARQALWIRMTFFFLIFSGSSCTKWPLVTARAM